MKKILTYLTLWTMTCSVTAADLFLKAGEVDYMKDGALVAIWTWGGSEADTWSIFAATTETDIAKTTIAEGRTGGKIVRFAAGTAAPAWSGVKIWNQTGDLSLPTDGKDMVKLPQWDDATTATWTKHDEQGGGGDTPQPTDYSTAVPSQCSDVMLQAFYWDSSDDKGYGNTKWSTLINQTEEIGQYFSLVWLPPSSKPSYISSKLGYIADDYSNQSSNLGLKAFLVNLITSFHQHNVRVLADIVINHCGNYNSKCNFFALDFGTYGSFTPNETWITSDDEEACNRNGNKDDGQHDANYAAARDWDHTKSDVQAMCRAYLKWMKGEMKYDGFRFDYCGGYHVKHVNDYVSAAKPYFSVMEYWDGNADNLKSRIDDASKNTLTFDFATMYTAFQQGIVANNYGKCVNPGLRGKGYEKYAVTFIDNHDTFNRGTDQADVMGTRDGSSINNRSIMLQCNAYILSMPGVPCVFYPHWVKYKTAIKEMIKARWIAGIHSESKVQEESGNSYYKATITGKTGEIRLLLGANSGYATTPAGYTKAYAGDNCGVYYKGTGSWPREQQTEMEVISEETRGNEARGTKVLHDGQLLIEYDGQRYDVFGRTINKNK